MLASISENSIGEGPRNASSMSNVGETSGSVGSAGVGCIESVEMSHGSCIPCGGCTTSNGKETNKPLIGECPSCGSAHSLEDC